MYLLDSDYIIYFLKGQKRTVDVIQKLSKAKLYTSIICVGEVLEGLYYSKRKNKKYLEIFENFLKTLIVLDVNKKIIQEFSILRGSLRSKGKLIDNFDLLIAATCLSYNLILATGNKSHFTRIPKLEIFKFDSKSEQKYP